MKAVTSLIAAATVGSPLISADWRSARRLLAGIDPAQVEAAVDAGFASPRNAALTFPESDSAVPLDSSDYPDAAFDHDLKKLDQEVVSKQMDKVMDYMAGIVGRLTFGNPSDDDKARKMKAINDHLLNYVAELAADNVGEPRGYTT